MDRQQREGYIIKKKKKLILNKTGFIHINKKNIVKKKTKNIVKKTKQKQNFNSWCSKLRKHNNIY